MTKFNLIRTNTHQLSPISLRAGIARTAKVTSAIEPDARYFIPVKERTSNALYFFNNRMATGRKAVWLWASMITLALFPRYPQKTINKKIANESEGEWKLYADTWKDTGFVSSMKIRKDLTRKVFVATVPIAILPKTGFPMKGLSRLAAATIGSGATTFPEWKDYVEPSIDDAFNPDEYDLKDVSPNGTTRSLDLDNFRAAKGRIVVRDVGAANIGAFMQLEFTQRESEFLCNSSWLEIRPLDFFGVIRAWVDGLYGARSRSPSFSIPIGRIAKASDAKMAAPRLSEDSLSMDEHGTIICIPAKLNEINSFEDKAASAFIQEDGSFSSVRDDGQLKTPPPAMPVYVDWVNLKYAYTTLDGKLVLKNLDRSQPVNITHIRRFLEKRIGSDEVLNFLSFTLNLGAFFQIKEVQAIVNKNQLLYAISKEVERRDEYMSLEETPLIAIQEYAGLDNGNTEVLLNFCNLVKKLKKFIDENPVNAYAKYSVPTIIELQGVLTVFSVYAHKFGEVKALDNTRREPYEKQASDPNWKLEPVPFIVDDPIGRGLMPHQVDVQNKLRGCPDNAIMPVDAGGGKTSLIVYEILKMMKTGGSDMFLIMCPSHLVAQYVKEFVYFTGSKINVIPVTTYTIRRHGFKRLGEMILSSPLNTVVVTDYNVITYRQSTIAYGSTPIKLFPVIEFLRQYPFKYVAADEAHFLKNGSARNAAAGRLMIEIPKKRLASGTMVANQITDLVRQIALMDPSVFGTVDDFIKEYALKMVGGKVIEWKKGAELAVQRRINQNVVTAGAKRKEWAAILPFPVEAFHVVEFSANQLKCYQEILERVQTELRKAAETNDKLYRLLAGENMEGEDGEDGKPFDLDKLMRQFSVVIERFMAAPGLDPVGKLVLTGDDLVSPKVVKVIKICQEHIDQNLPGKILIFTSFADSATAVYDAMPPDLKSRFIYYTAGNKDACVAEFDANPNIVGMVGIETSMNTGLNLQAASRLIRVESVWTPGALEQGNSRVGRPNIKNKELRPNVYYDWIVVNYTIDVTKTSYLMAKTISKAKFDEAGNPPFDDLEVPPLFSLTLDNVLAMNDCRVTLVDYFSKYDLYKKTLRKEFADYKAANYDKLFVKGPDGKDLLKMAALESVSAPAGSAVMRQVPYVPGTELYKASELGLIRYDAYMRLDTEALEAESEDEEDGQDAGAEDDNEDAAEMSASDEAKAALLEERAKAAGMTVHTEFGTGEIIRVLRKSLKVQLPNGGVFRVNKLAAFVVTKDSTLKKDVRTQLLKLNGELPIDTDQGLEDSHLIKLKPLKKKRPVDVEEPVIAPVDVAIEMVLDFTIVNDFLGIRLVNTDNEAAVRVAQGMGFKHPPSYFAAKIPFPRHLLNLFKLWNTLGFEIDKENSRACEVAYRHFFANRQSAPNFYGVANDNSIRNFYKLEFKPNPSKIHINPYPLMQDNELYVALPKNGHPGSVPAMTKGRVPGVKWFVYDSDTELIAFTPRKEKASVLIKSLLEQGVVISNIKDLIKKFRKLRLARDQAKDGDESL